MPTPVPRLQRQMLAILLLAMPLIGFAQSQSPSAQELLPRRSGPAPAHPLKCAVMAWEQTGDKPSLTLICPPEDVYSPIRLVLKLSWKEVKEIPDGLRDLELFPGDIAKVKLSSKAAVALLRIRADVRGRPGHKWVKFNELLQVGIVVED